MKIDWIGSPTRLRVGYNEWLGVFKNPLYIMPVFWGQGNVIIYTIRDGEILDITDSIKALVISNNEAEYNKALEESNNLPINIPIVNVSFVEHYLRDVEKNFDTKIQWYFMR